MSLSPYEQLRRQFEWGTVVAAAISLALAIEFPVLSEYVPPKVVDTAFGLSFFAGAVGSFLLFDNKDRK